MDVNDPRYIPDAYQQKADVFPVPVATPVPQQVVQAQPQVQAMPSLVDQFQQMLRAQQVPQRAPVRSWGDAGQAIASSYKGLLPRVLSNLASIPGNVLSNVSNPAVLANILDPEGAKTRMAMQQRGVENQQANNHLLAQIMMADRTNQTALLREQNDQLQAAARAQHEQDKWNADMEQRDAAQKETSRYHDASLGMEQKRLEKPPAEKAAPRPIEGGDGFYNPATYEKLPIPPKKTEKELDPIKKAKNITDYMGRPIMNKFTMKWEYPDAQLKADQLLSKGEYMDTHLLYQYGVDLAKLSPSARARLEAGPDGTLLAPGALDANGKFGRVEPPAVSTAVPGQTPGNVQYVFK